MPPSSNSSPRSGIRGLIFFFLLLGLVTAWHGSRAFYGQLYVSVARNGTRDLNAREQFLRRAIAHDPAAGRANVELARLLDKSDSYGAALQHLQIGMRTFRPISSYLQLGLLLDNIGKKDEARSVLESAVRMNPGNIRAMEQLALVAISQGDSAAVEYWTDAIRNRDFTNLNAQYLRARDAERLKNQNGARTLYQQISSQIHSLDTLPPGTLFSRNEITRRLADSEGTKR
jgi:lipopolysaccharide biosynthesis regulator YciM